MRDLSELIPELGLWNGGNGVAPDDWITSVGRADHALGFCTLMWPSFETIGSYVLRAPVDLTRLQGWEANVSLTRQQIETAMNAFFLDGAFPQDGTAAALKEAQCEHLAGFMTEMLTAKLADEFPERQFTAFIIDDGDDLAVSFPRSDR